MTEIKAQININGRIYSSTVSVSDAVTTTWNMEKIVRSTVNELFETVFEKMRQDGVFGKEEKPRRNDSRGISGIL
jgi:hypothetical protein